jgi:ribosomal RNA-processing protein 36
MRDPRFDPLSGHFNKDLYKRSYGSHIDKLQTSELQHIEDKLKKSKDVGEKDQLEQLRQSLVKLF